MTGSAFFHTSVALGAGLTAQLVAARLAMPSIVLLLATGVLLGPDGIGLVDPGVFGGGTTQIVSLAVVVILFEGGLGLDLRRLGEQRRTLLLLLGVGGALSMGIGALAAHWLLAMPWSIAGLFGALMIVTGPTVVTPMMARLRVGRRVRELLISEGVLIDPVGAIIALVLAEWVVGRHALVESGWLAAWRMLLGAATGALAGRLVATALKRQWIVGDLIGPAVLASALFVAAVTSGLSAEAGLMSAVVQGVVLANAGLPNLGRLREFKEALTLLLLSFLFVMLAAGVRLSDVWALGWQALAVVAALIWVARPLAVLLATRGSELSPRERCFVAWICPRGIVAASVAGLFANLLDEAGVAGGRALEALVFVVVAVTVTVQGLTAGTVARWLGIDFPTLRGTVVVGADQLGRLLARLLAAHDRRVVLIDRDPARCRAARAEGLSVYEGDALSVDDLEDAGTRYADTLVALTRNPELNELVIQRARDSFRTEALFALRPIDGTAATAPDSLFPGRFAGIDEVNQLLGQNRMAVVEYRAAPGAAGRPLAELPFGEGEFALLVARDGAVRLATGDYVIAAGDRLWCARPLASDSGLAAWLGEGEAGPG